MPRTISLGTREEWAGQSVTNPFLVLLEITHPGLTEPARVAAGNDAVTLDGNTFQAIGIEVVLPEDGETAMPQARLAMANVGKELMQWIERTDGGRGAKTRLMVCVRGDDDSIQVEWETSLRVSRIEATPLRVVFDLGYSDLLNVPSVATRFDPDQAPGLF